MKTKITKFFAFCALLLMSAQVINASSVVQLRFTNSFSSTSSFTYSTTDVLYAIDAATMSTSTSNTIFPTPNNFRVQLKELVLELKSTSAQEITVRGMSSGSTSTRTIYQVSVADALAGPYSIVDDVTWNNTKITSDLYGQAVATSTTKVTGLNIAKGKFVKISFCTSTSGGTTQNVNVSGFDILPLPSGPMIELSSGSNATAAMETLAMTPAVYTYSNVSDENAMFEWYTDNTYSTVTAAPAGLSISKNTSNKTISVAGTPTTAGNYFYKVWVAGGNSIEGSVTVASYATPAPIINLTSSNDTQVIKANAAITNIIYNIQHVTAASASGLPNGLTSTFDNGQLTISGSIDAAVTPNTYTYTVNTTALSGYNGTAVSATGSIIVKAANAKNLLYMVGGATVDAKDIQLYPMLNSRSDLYLTVKTAQSTAPAASAYDSYDLIIIAESVAGNNVEAIALKSVDKPILNFKSFVYNTGRWVWGTADNGAANNGTISVIHATHPVFANIAVNTGAIEILSDAATKGIQPADVTLEGGYTIATAPKGNNANATAIHDVPASARSVINSKYIMIPVANDSYDKFSADGLQLVNNAVEYLLNGTQYVPTATSVLGYEKSSIYFDGQRIVNPEGIALKLYDATGRLVRTSNKDISTLDLNKGMYIVIAKDIKLKIVF